MKEEFKDYLSSLNMKKTLLNRADEIIVFFEETFEVTLIDIFVEEYTTQEGAREFVSLQLISDNLMLFEAKNFTKDVDEFSFSPFNNNVKNLKITKENYDFKSASVKSRFTLEFNTDDIYYELKSSQKNCDNLKNIFMKYIKPNSNIN